MSHSSFSAKVVFVSICYLLVLSKSEKRKIIVFFYIYPTVPENLLQTVSSG